VEMNVKYHSSQEMQDQYIAENVSKSTNHNKVVGLDLAEVPGLIEMTEIPGLEVQEVTEIEKCLLQPVVTVERNVKYHSSQEVINLFTVENVSKIINQNKVDLDLVEDQVMVEMTEVPGLEVQEVTEIEKCLLQPVVTVERNVKYHSSQEVINLFTVTNVSQITEISKDCFE